MQFLTDPWAWWVEPFTTYAFMQRVLLAGILAVLSTSVVGTWVVLRGMSFLGDALAHGVLPGIAIAFILGGNVTLGALLAALVMASGISTVRRLSPLRDDSAIGLLFVGMLALGVVILSSQSGSYVGDLSQLLFGAITGINDQDILRSGITTAISIGGSLLFYRAFLVSTFDETQAQLLGMRPRLAHFALLILLAVSIVSSIEVVGTLLVFALLIGPPATAWLLIRRVPFMMVTAVLIGSFTTLIGILISYHYDTAAGATMALSSVTLFLLVLFLRQLPRLGRRQPNRQVKTAKTAKTAKTLLRRGRRRSNKAEKEAWGAGRA